MSIKNLFKTVQLMHRSEIKNQTEKWAVLTKLRIMISIRCDF